MGIWIYRIVAWLLLTTHDNRTNADESVVNQLFARIEALEKRCKKQEELIKQLIATIETQAVEIQQLRFEVETMERNETVTIHRLDNETTSLPTFANDVSKGETQEEIIKQLNATIYTQASQIQQLREFEVETRGKYETIDRLDNETTFLRIFANDVNKGLNTNKTTIAFHVSSGHLRENQTIVFYRENLNVGKAYDRKHNVFVATVKGIYLFSVSIKGHADSRKFDDRDENYSANVGIMKNGREIASVISEIQITCTYGRSPLYCQHKHIQGSTTVVMQLAIGDKVWVSSRNGIALAGDNTNSFMGVLVASI